ncbi:PilW family protein [Derxia lacustris]|uniref:PilW family protein n=1 Tax=Derxia lacustris TaxID=764842 RepID=UPI001C387308|nr:PilW family protein [Derxia lacustris]
MIAMAIGLGMSIAVSSLYISSRGASKTSDAAVEVRSNGRLALQLLTEQLRMAGYGDYLSGWNGSRYKGSTRTGWNASGIGYAVNGCDGRFTKDVNAPAGCGSVNADQASIALAYHAATSSSTNGANVDCVGDEAETDAATGFQTVSNTYFIATDSNTQEPTLYCQGGGGSGVKMASPQPLVTGVEQFVIRYGVDINSDFSVDRVLTATEIRHEAAEKSPKYDFSNVQSVEICLVIRSSQKGSVTLTDESLDCNEQKFASDGRYRQRFRTTVNIRNKTYRP